MKQEHNHLHQGIAELMGKIVQECSHIRQPIPGIDGLTSNINMRYNTRFTEATRHYPFCHQHCATLFNGKLTAFAVP